MKAFILSTLLVMLAHQLYAGAEDSAVSDRLYNIHLDCRVGLVPSEASSWEDIEVLREFSLDLGENETDISANESVRIGDEDYDISVEISRHELENSETGQKIVLPSSSIKGEISSGNYAAGSSTLERQKQYQEDLKKNSSEVGLQIGTGLILSFRADQTGILLICNYPRGEES